MQSAENHGKTPSREGLAYISFFLSIISLLGFIFLFASLLLNRNAGPEITICAFISLFCALPAIICGHIARFHIHSL